MLSTHASECSTTTSIHIIRDPEESHKRHNLRGQLNHSRIVVEDLGKVIPRTHQNSQHNGAECHCEEDGCMRARAASCYESHDLECPSLCADM